MPPTGTESDVLHTCRVSRAGSSICKNFTLELKTTWFSFLMRNRRLHQLNQQYTYLVSVVWLILYGKSYHTISARQHNNRSYQETKRCWKDSLSLLNLTPRPLNQGLIGITAQPIRNRLYSQTRVYESNVDVLIVKNILSTKENARGSS